LRQGTSKLDSPWRPKRFCRHNQLYRIPNDALQSFPNLKTLKMFSNKIDHVYGHDFEHNPKLQVKVLQDFGRDYVQL